VVDLKISEIVDGGEYIVSALLPEAIFASTPASMHHGTRIPERIPEGVAA
jgi:hypothetical protein